MNHKNIKEYIKALDHLKGFLINLLEEEENFILPADYTAKEFTELRKLLKSPSWPEAVPNELICDDNIEEKMERAYGFINKIETSLDGKKFLDIGCGEGHTIYAAASYKTEISAGYDINKDKKWKKNSGIILTNKWEDLKKLGLFDIILINDVLDHAEDPLEVLLKAKEIKEKELGRIFLKVHPWTSRHGTHVYKDMNKAYIHCVFTEEEIQKLGLDPLKTNKVLNPKTFYRNLIEKAGLRIIKEELVTQSMEVFFTHNPKILQRIKSINPEFETSISEIQMIEYILI